MYTMKEKLRRRNQPEVEGGGTPSPATQPEAPSPTPYEAAIFAAELGGEAPELDLHGLEIDQALSELDTFLHHQMMLKAEVLKIIHGRGEQKLQRAIHEWLRQAPQSKLVAYFRGSENPTHQNAVTYLALHSLG